MDAALIKKQLDRIGSTAYLKERGQLSLPFRCVITHLWRKKSTSFEPHFTPLGKVKGEYYLYIGPAEYDITACDENTVLLSGGAAYEFKNRDAVRVQDKILYYTGILRKIGEGDTDDN